MATYEELASYRRCTGRIAENWRSFHAMRYERLREQERFGHSAERAAECIVEDLFTGVLDWSPGDINHQVGFADLMLTRLGIKYLIVETKGPRTLAWNRNAVDAALEQAWRYAAEQMVRCIAVSDGVMFYAADVGREGLRDRVFCSLEHPQPQLDLWWLSMDGIYRVRSEPGAAAPRLLPETPPAPLEHEEGSDEALMHPRYALPARCFAYVGNATDVRTWHLPYLNADGTVDNSRLPKAVQAIVSNYRGARVSSIPEPAIPDVLVRLACAAGSLGKLPGQASEPARAYVQLVAALEQLGLLDAVRQTTT